MGISFRETHRDRLREADRKEGRKEHKPPSLSLSQRLSGRRERDSNKALLRPSTCEARLPLGHRQREREGRVSEGRACTVARGRQARDEIISDSEKKTGGERTDSAMEGWRGISSYSLTLTHRQSQVDQASRVRERKGKLLA